MRNKHATATVAPEETDAAWRCLVHKIDVIRSWIATGAANN